MLAPVSNGNISLMVDLARRNEFPWDAILGAEIAGDYKPKPRVYLAACEALDLAPAQCMMVAAHRSDLAAAAQCGLRTAHTARVDEYGPNTGEAEADGAGRLRRQGFGGARGPARRLTAHPRYTGAGCVEEAHRM